MLGPIMEAAAESAAAGHPLALEMVVSQLLGVVWSMFDIEREEPMAELVAGISAQLSRRGEAGQAAIRVIDRLAAPADATDQAGLVMVSGDGADWSTARAVMLDGFCCGDAFGDQTNYVMSFGFLVGGRIVGHHTIVAMVDHNLHLLKDAFPAIGEEAFEDVRAMLSEADGLAITALDPAKAATDLQAAILSTEATPDVAAILNEFTDSTWHLLKSRLAACLPVPGEPDDPKANWPEAARKKEVESFLRSTAAAALLGPNGPPRAGVRSLIRVFVDYACDYGRGDPWAWSPTAVEIFLVEVGPNQVLWDPEAIPWVAPTLAVFVEWAMKRRGVPAPFRAQAVAAIVAWGPGFEQAVMAGNNAGPVAAMLAAAHGHGLDLSDPVAVQRAIDNFISTQPSDG